MRLSKKPADTPRPAVDEWGIYDPDQAGLAAVLERIEARRRATATPPHDAEALASSMREAKALLKKSAK